MDFLGLADPRKYSVTLLLTLSVAPRYNDYEPRQIENHIFTRTHTLILTYVYTHTETTSLTVNVSVTLTFTVFYHSCTVLKSTKHN